MAEPTLKATSVQINYTASDGYRSEVGFNSRTAKTEPKAALLGGIEEMARTLALFGHEAEARAAVDAAFARVAEWRANRKESS